MEWGDARDEEKAGKMRLMMEGTEKNRGQGVKTNAKA
jgi:hypothetical protein